MAKQTRPNASPQSAVNRDAFSITDVRLAHETALAPSAKRAALDAFRARQERFAQLERQRQARTREER